MFTRVVVATSLENIYLVMGKLTNSIFKSEQIICSTTKKLLTRYKRLQFI